MEGGDVPVTRYQVTGPRPYMGHQPGETFDAELPPDQEQRAKDRGSLRVVKRDEKTNEKAGEKDA